jgi:hypothetical protein
MRVDDVAGKMRLALSRGGALHAGAPGAHGVHAGAAQLRPGHGDVPRPSRAVKVEPISPTTTATGNERLKLKYHKMLSKFAFKSNLRRYILGRNSWTLEDFVAFYRHASAGRAESMMRRHVIPHALCTGACHVVHRCWPRHPAHCVPVLATSSSTLCTGGCHIIHHIVYRPLPRYPPQCVPVLATSSITLHTGACHVIHRIVHRCLPRHPPHCVPVVARSSST